MSGGTLRPAVIAVLAAAAVSARAQDEGDEDAGSFGRWREARPRSSYPVVPVQFTVRDGSIDRYAPALVPLGGDDALLVHLAWKFLEGDRVVAAELRPGVAPKVVPVTAQPGQYLWPAGVAVSADVHLFWIEIDGGRAWIATARRTAGPFTPPARLTELVGCLSRPAVLAHAGKVWLAWESHAPSAEGAADGPAKGGADLFLASVEGDTLGPQVRVADGRFGDVEPVLAGAPDGSLWIAWAQYGGRDFEILARRFEPTRGELGPPVNVSADPLADDFHPTARCDGQGRLWLAWDALTDLRRGRSFRHGKDDPPRGSESSVRVACIEGGAVRDLLLPDGSRSLVAADTGLSWSGGVPQLVVDPRGGLLLAHRYFDEEGDAGPCHSYPVLLRELGAGGIQEPRLLEGSEGDLEEPAVAAGATGFWLVAQADERIAQTQSRLKGGLARALQRKLLDHDIDLAGAVGPARLRIAFVPWPAREPAGPPATRERTSATNPTVGSSGVATSPPRSHPFGAPEADPLLNGASHREYRSGDAVLRAWYGDLHRHSNHSRCLNGIEARPLDRYLFAREVWLDDFFALTDHPGHLDPCQWWQQCKLVDLAHSPAFCVFQGFEWSNGEFGHQNVLFRRRTDQLFGQYHDPTREPAGLWSRLKPGDAITIPHHPAHVKIPLDWDEFDPRFVRVVELFQSARESFEFPGAFRESASAGAEGCYVQDALGRGLTFGFIASSDHGNEAAYAVALAPELGRDAIFDALHARRTFASTTKGLFVDFQVDGHAMGEEIRCAAAPRLRVAAQGTEELNELVVFRNGEVVRALGRAPRPSVADGAVTRLVLRWWFFVGERAGTPAVRLSVAGGTIRLATKERRGGDAAEARRTVEFGSDGSVSIRLDDGYRRMLDLLFDVEAPRDAAVALTVGTTTSRTTLGRLVSEPVADVDDLGSFTLKVVGSEGADPVVPGHSLGVREVADEWTDESAPAGRSWYYARVIDVRGEASWSSPIFVTRE